MDNTEQSFEFEAREMASDEHFTLARRLEEMRDNPSENTPSDIYWWKRDYKWDDNPAEFFENNRDHFLEQAREMYAENAA